MPNWIVHLGLQYGAVKAIPHRFRDVTLFMLGAITPDIASVVYVGLLDVLNVQKHFDFIIWYFQPFHTPFMSVLIGLMIALFLKGPKPAYFFSYSAGAMLHFVLDSTQKHIGFHILLGYPFTFQDLNLNLFFTDHVIYYIFTWISLGILVTILLFEKERSHVDIRHVFDRTGMPFGFVLLALILVFPFFTKDDFFRNNYHYINFFTDKEDFTGKKIALCVSEVVSTEPLKVFELNKILELHYSGSIRLKKGDFVSLEGIYNGKSIDVDFIRIHGSYRFKRITSIIGLIFFILIIINAETGVFQWHVRTSIKN